MFLNQFTFIFQLSVFIFQQQALKYYFSDDHYFVTAMNLSFHQHAK